MRVDRWYELLVDLVGINSILKPFGTIDPYGNIDVVGVIGIVRSIIDFPFEMLLFFIPTPF
jgi:hypothetical protein